MKGMKTVIAGAGVMSLAALGMFGGGDASAATPVKIERDGISPTQFTVSHQVVNVVGPVNGTFSYQVRKCDGTPDTVTYETHSSEFEYKNYTLREQPDMKSTHMISSLVDATFSAVGTYEFCIEETAANTKQGMKPDDTVYKVFVNVTNRKDSSGEYTGELIARLVPQALNTKTGEKGEIIFTSEQNLTYIEVTHKLKGNMADLDQYFAYELRLSDSSLPNKMEVSISGLDEYYVDPKDGQTKQNITSLALGETGVIYLKHGQTVYIGIADGQNQLPADFNYTLTLRNASESELLYDGGFDGGPSGATISKSTVLLPAEGASPEEIEQFNKSNKVLITRWLKDVSEDSSGVATGVVSKIAPFAVLVVVGGLTGFLMKRQSDKSRKEVA